MGRRRKSNPLNLPERVYPSHGAFYYQHRDGKWEHLGTDIEAAKRRATEITHNGAEGYGTVAYWLDEFLKSCQARVKAGDMAQRTLDDYTRDAVPLKAFFGEMLPAGVAAPHIADYLDTNRDLGRGVRANRERACLSAMFTWLVRGGKADLQRNVCIGGPRRNKETKRDRYVEHAEMRDALVDAPVQVSALAGLVYRTLQRPEDIIRWTRRNLTTRVDATGREVKIIRCKQSKTGITVDIEISPEIDAILASLKPPKGTDSQVVQGLTLIHRLDGKPYTYDGLCAMLKRRQKTAGVLAFGYYDLKGKGATDMWQAGVPLERIQLLCGHESVTTTETYVKRRWRGIAEPNRVAMGA